MTVVRCNHKAIMYADSKRSNYSIFDLNSQEYTYKGTLNACKKAWNRHYKTRLQYITLSNHRYISKNV
mgnify:CR=1 FL=1